MLYSPTGLYVLFNGEDRKLTATIEKDFEDLWNEDAFEFFLWPDERQTVYFEYEISPLNHELAILIPNFDGRFLGWRPWHYEGARKTRKATSVRADRSSRGPTSPAGRPKSSSRTPYWSRWATCRRGRRRRWRANFYRVDYDGGHGSGWDWIARRPQFPRVQQVRRAWSLNSNR